MVGGVAVVTGGSSGIGAAIARRLAERGWRCVLIARGEERLRVVAEEVGGEVETCDVADRAAVEAVAARIAARHPALGLLVNNAGVPARTGFVRGEPERIEAAVRVNYLGAVWCARAFLPGLEAGRPSHVVNVVSVAGTVAVGAAGPYVASKHAALAFSRSLATELRARGVAVHTVNPGFVDTEGFPQERLLRHPLLRHIVIGPEQVADAVVRAIERNRGEVFVPGWYRAAAAAYALAPGLFARVVARRRGPRARG